MMTTLGQTLRRWREEWALTLPAVTAAVNRALQSTGLPGGIESTYMARIEDDQEPQGSASLRALEHGYGLPPYSLERFNPRTG